MFDDVIEQGQQGHQGRGQGQGMTQASGYKRKTMDKVIFISSDTLFQSIIIF